MNTLNATSEVLAEISKGIEAQRAASELTETGIVVGVKPRLTKAQKDLLAIEEKMALELAEKCSAHAKKYKTIITQSSYSHKT